MSDIPDEFRADVKELRQGVASLTVTVARIDERTTRVEAIDGRLRSVEDKLAVHGGIGRAGAQGVAWVLPIALSLLGILSSVITYLATRR